MLQLGIFLKIKMLIIIRNWKHYIYKDESDVVIKKNELNYHLLKENYEFERKIRK